MTEFARFLSRITAENMKLRRFENIQFAKLETDPLFHRLHARLLGGQDGQGGSHAGECQ